MNVRDVMDIDTNEELRNRTWWWWFLLFFFKPDKGRNWKQLMVLWGTRNCRRLKVNDMVWNNNGSLTRKGDSIEVPGITAAWYYDGKRMIEPLFIDHGKLTSKWSRDNGSLALENGGRVAFTMEHDGSNVAAQMKDVRLDLELLPWTPYFNKLVYTGKNYMSFLGYKMVKIRAVKAQGTVTIGGREEKVQGTAYFQKVRINSPTSPWYFGTFHSEKGHYIDYFMPHLGPPMFRKGYGEKSRLDFGERMLSKGLQFVDGDGANFGIKNIRMKKRFEGDLPVFHLSGEEVGKRLELEMKCYSRACWRVEQPLLGIFSTVLHYNEYPAYVTKFRFEANGREINLDDMGFTIGNCEHSWGIV